MIWFDSGGGVFCPAWRGGRGVGPWLAVGAGHPSGRCRYEVAAWLKAFSMPLVPVE